MLIGIPRALLYFKYGRLWEVFFEGLGVEYILSPETNRQILSEGLRFSIDESCLPAKIYLGHTARLIGKCDYILIPRVETLAKGRDSEACVKFYAAYDTVKNTFAARLEASGTKLLDYNVDAANGRTEEKAFIKMGAALGFSRFKAAKAYSKARAAQDLYDSRRAANALRLSAAAGPKILVTGHPYNIYDPLIGAPVIRYLEKLGITPVLANEFDSGLCAAAAAGVSKTLYWFYNKELAGATSLYGAKTDGIIFITAFPCGPDSLVTELMLRKFRGVPKLNLVMDELQSESGLQTRLESFTDIILQRRGGLLKREGRVPAAAPADGIAAQIGAQA